MVNKLQKERARKAPSSCAVGSGDPSIKDHQKAYSEWAAVIIDDILKALLRAAELGSAVSEVWLVYNAAASLWNYSHWLAINRGSLIAAFRQVLPIFKKVDLKRFDFRYCMIALLLLRMSCSPLKPELWLSLHAMIYSRPVRAAEPHIWWQELNPP